MMRTFAAHELAARAWHTLSCFPSERGLAARRFRELATIASDDTRLQVIGELALEGFHAFGITAVVMRDRARFVDAFAPPDAAVRDDVRRVVAAIRVSMRMPGSWAR